VSGAAALVKLRGHEQFKTEAGQRLFQQVTSNLMISCIQRSTPMPAHVLELRETMAENIDASSLTWKLSSCIVDFTIFRAAVRSFQVTGPRVIVKAALELDQRFLEIFKDPPDTWSYETVYTEEDPHLIWNKYYHVYPDKVCSQIWNGFRTCRILLHEIIREQVLTSKSAITPIFSEAEADLQCEASREIMLEMRAGILASVPQTNPDPLIHGTATHSLSYYIMWPLYLVAVMDLTTNEVRCWVAQRLRSIAREVGIQQAGVMADFLDRKEPLDPWLLNAPTPRKLPKLFRMKLDEERTLEIDEERAVDIMMPTRSALRTSSQCENPPAIQDLEATTRPCDM
jgi:hypothetical protein